MSRKSRNQSKKNRFYEDDDFDYIVVDDLENESFQPKRTQTTWNTVFRSENSISVKPKHKSHLPNYWQIAAYRDETDYEDWETWYLQ